MVQSVGPFARLSVRHHFQYTYDDEMMHKAWSCLEEVPYCFSRSFIKCQGHTAKKMILTQIGRFRTVTPVEFSNTYEFSELKLKFESSMALT